MINADLCTHNDGILPTEQVADSQNHILHSEGPPAGNGLEQCGMATWAHLQQEVGAAELAEEGNPGSGAEVQAVLEVHKASDAGAPLHIPDHGIRTAANSQHPSLTRPACQGHGWHTCKLSMPPKYLHAAQS